MWTMTMNSWHINDVYPFLYAHNFYTGTLLFTDNISLPLELAWGSISFGI